MAVRDGLTKVRMFLGRLQGVQNVLTMGFFESYIQRFMSYLADLAMAQGSTDFEYTDVHGVCDIAHSEGLLTALSAEAAVNPPDSSADLFEGVNELRALIRPSTEMGMPRYLLPSRSKRDRGCTNCCSKEKSRAGRLLNGFGRRNPIPV